MTEIQLDRSEYPNIDTDFIEYSITTVLNKLGKGNTDITLKLTDNQEIMKLNQNYRGKAKATDVLSFNQDFLNPENDRFYLGDIVISVNMAQQQAGYHNHSLNEECVLLAIHGVLHLLGYDHTDKKSKQEMWSKQEELFEFVKTSYQESCR